MNDKIYKVIPFEEVAIGQKFERGEYKEFKGSPWIKMSATHISLEHEAHDSSYWIEHSEDFYGFMSLVCIADCKPASIFPLPLPLTVRGEGADSWLEDANGRAVIPSTQGLSEDEHVNFLNWISAKAK